MPRLYNSVQLPNIDFTPTQVQLATYTPQEPNYEIFNRQIEQLERDREAANTGYFNISEVFDKISGELGDDEQTRDYLFDNQSKIEKSVRNLIDIGDYSEAINQSKNMLGKFMNSPEYRARREQNKEKSKWYAELDKSDIDENLKDYYKDLTKDLNFFKYDDEGNITGADVWNPAERGISPVKSRVDINGLLDAAVKSAAADKTDTNSRNINVDGTGRQRGYSSEVLTADKISNQAKAIINNQYRQYFNDKLLAGLHQINKLEQALLKETDVNRQNYIKDKIKSYQNEYYKNGAPLTYDEYIEKYFGKDSDYIKNTAYNYKHTTNVSDNQLTGTGTQLGSVNGYNFGGYNSFNQSNSSSANSSFQIIRKDSGFGYATSAGNRKGLTNR